MNRESEGKSIGIPHLAKNERDMGHPSFVREPGIWTSVSHYPPTWRLLCAAFRALLVVVGPHAANLSSGIQQHHLGGLVAANIVDVIDDDRLNPPKCIDQVEAQIRKALKTSEKIISQCSFSSHRAIAAQ